MVWKRIIDALLPRICLGCKRRLLSHEQYFCTSCMSEWARPRLNGNAGDNELARLFWGFFPIEGAASAYIYNQGTSISELLHNMKYRSKPHLCRRMGQVMAADPLIAGILSTADALVPVPLTPKRQRERQYNQSEELCRGMSQATGIPVLGNVLKRVKFADSQTTMTREERLTNIRGAFALADATRIEGSHVVVVDDVITTGATVSECLLTLRDVPGIRISVVSLGWTHHL